MPYPAHGLCYGRTRIKSLISAHSSKKKKIYVHISPTSLMIRIAYGTHQKWRLASRSEYLGSLGTIDYAM